MELHPDPGFEGEDSFQFLVSDGLLESDIAVVRISVIPDDGQGQDALPVVTLLGESLIVHEAGIPLPGSGALAEDPEDGTLEVTTSGKWMCGSWASRSPLHRYRQSRQRGDRPGENCSCSGHDSSRVVPAG